MADACPGRLHICLGIELELGPPRRLCRCNRHQSGPLEATASAHIASTSGNRAMPCRWRPRCSADRVRCEICRPQRIKAILQQRQPVAPKGADHRLLRLPQNCRAMRPRSGLVPVDRYRLARRHPPLEPIPGSRFSCASAACDHLVLLRGGVRGRGSAVTNMSHRACVHPFARSAASNHGIKHLPSGRATRTSRLRRCRWRRGRARHICSSGWRCGASPRRERTGPRPDDAASRFCGHGAQVSCCRGLCCAKSMKPGRPPSPDVLIPRALSQVAQ